MQLVAIGIAYQGQQYAGWQRQTNDDTVQARVELALSHIANAPVTLFCAGRTDAGVNATGQVAHFVTDVTRENHAWVRGANRYLPSDIRLIWAQPVDDSFHARFAALNRRYHYYINNHPIALPALQGRATWCPYPLDVARMHIAAQDLVGQHDFTSFRASTCQAPTAERHLFAIEVTRVQHTICLEVVANAFLHHMVRNIVGALLAVGTGKREVSWIAALLAAKNRCEGAMTAEPDGLYLTGVRYPAKYDLPTENTSQLTALFF